MDKYIIHTKINYIFVLYLYCTLVVLFRHWPDALAWLLYLLICWICSDEHLKQLIQNIWLVMQTVLVNMAGRKLRRMHFGSFANKVDGILPYPHSDCLLLVKRHCRSVRLTVLQPLACCVAPPPARRSSPDRGRPGGWRAPRWGMDVRLPSDKRDREGDYHS